MMQSSPKQRSVKQDLWLVANLAWSVGWIVAIPAVLFGFGGAYLDRTLGTTPLFILVGLAGAITLSGVGLYRKLRKILTQWP